MVSNMRDIRWRKGKMGKETHVERAHIQPNSMKEKKGDRSHGFFGSLRNHGGCDSTTGRGKAAVGPEVSENGRHMRKGSNSQSGREINSGTVGPIGKFQWFRGGRIQEGGR